MSQEPRPGVLRGQPSIAHLDADAFFASVEQHQKPSLKGRPVLVGGSGPRGVVAAASYEARAFGVRSAMSMALARRKCPQATVLVPRPAAYSAYSAAVMAALRERTELVEPLSIDEAFADLGHLSPGPDGWTRVAADLRARAVELSGVPVSVGMGRSKLVAKLASAAAKPAGVLVVAPDGEDRFLLPLPVRSLWGVGPVSAERLERIGVRTVEDLRTQPLDTLVALVGDAAGTNLYRVARGWDDRPVTVQRERKSAGAERTFDSDLYGRAQVAAQIPAVTAQAMARLSRRAAAARTVTVKVRFADFTTVSRSVTLSSPSSDSRVLTDAARRALDLVETDAPVRLLGVSFHGLSEHAQLALDIQLDDEPDAPQASHASEEPDVDEPAAPSRARRTHGSLREQDCAPGVDLEHPRYGRGWLVRVRDDGRVAVRFETAATGPGRQLNVEMDELQLVAPLGPDGAPAT
ncbi:DNA polymerase IV [Puerhibacterium puerhi]|uniref:DNA polymerase IV n=1 Tax=Puerhibacterium puerhi TaxID=2692623 RepID=UPI001356931B|nr:DNA polymerase IV [Puerhibacterium puerhi]